MDDMFHKPDPRQLRHHQAEAIQLLRQSLGKGFKRVVLQLPTGAGKTVTAAKIFESALSKGRKCLFTVPRLSLVDQTVAEFQREGLTDIGVIQANHPRTNASAMLQVASVQTLARRQIPDDFGLVLVDEAHETFEIIYQLMARWPSVPFVGLSATPWARGMGNHWQDLVIGTTIGKLIELGLLSKFTAYAPDMPDLTKVKTVAGDYAEKSLEEIMGENKLVASVVETWLEKGENRPTLLFGVNRAHAAQLQQQFIRAGVSAGYCDAFTDSVERQLLARRFREGEVKVACSVRTLTTGVDWPVSCIIDAAPTQSEMLHVQKIGRGLRVNPGTEDCLILDHAGNSLRLGLVTEIFHGKLDKTQKGEKQERKPKAEKLPKECANCGALMVGLICPYCGHEKTINPGVDTVEGQLSEITGKVKAPTKDEKQKFWSMALHLDAQRGKGGKLAAGMYKGKFGVWPRGLNDVHLPPDQAFMNWDKSRRIAFAKRKEAEKRAGQGEFNHAP